mgnify:CR=1 FL=1
MLKTYFKTLKDKIQSATTVEERNALLKKLEYARAYRWGAKALDEFRDKLIASKLNAVVNRDAQLAILFNQAKHPDEYEAYQKLRVDKKAEADVEMLAMRAELEAALETEVSE